MHLATTSTTLLFCSSNLRPVHCPWLFFSLQPWPDCSMLAEHYPPGSINQWHHLVPRSKASISILWEILLNSQFKFLHSSFSSWCMRCCRWYTVEVSLLQECVVWLLSHSRRRSICTLFNSCCFGSWMPWGRGCCSSCLSGKHPNKHPEFTFLLVVC